MKRTFKKLLRTGMSLVLVASMMVGMCASAFAMETPEEINYVSLGDSMANGYCFVGYNQGSNDRNEYDFIKGEGMYGEDAYPLQFEAYLEDQGYEVNHTKLAPSALLAEDLLYLLDGREEPQDGWGGFKDYIGTYDETEMDKVKDHFQTAITNADVITMGIGNAAFGAYMLDRVTSALGIFGASLDEDEQVDFEQAIEVLDLDEEQYALVMEVYNELVAQMIEAVPAELVAEYNLDQIVDVVSYTAASFVVNYKLLLDKIVEMNPDVEIVLVGLLNTTYGMNVTDDMGEVLLPVGDVMDGLFGTLNAYIAGLPTVMQAAGEWEDATFYYAEQPEPKFICQEFAELKDADWGDIQGGRLSGKTVRERNITAFNDSLAGMIGYAVMGAPLPGIELEDVQKYEEKPVNSWADANEKSLSVAIYLAIEEAVANSTDTMDIQLSGLMKIAGDLSSVFTSLGTPPTTSPEASRTWLLNGLTTEETLGMCKIYGLFKVGNGMSVHPTPEGHDEIAAAVIAAYDEKHTAADKTIENLTFAAELMAALVAEYYDEAYAAAYKYAEENGYIDATAAAIDALIAELEKINVAAMEMSEAAKAEIEAEIAKAIAALEAAKALLIEDITVLTQETIAALEAALNEGAEAIKNLQNMIKQAAMDAQEEAYAALENAYDTLINVVIPTAKEQLGIAVSEATEWLMEKAQETYDALVEALVEAAEVYGPKAAAALYDYLLNNPEEVIAFFREYGPDAAEFFAENAEVIMEVLDFLVEEFGDDAIAFVMENPVEVLGTMVYLAVEYGDEAWALIVVYAEALGITGEAIENGLADAMEQLSALVKEYGALVAQGAYDYIMEQGYVEALEQAICDLIAEIESQIDCLENQVCKQIETAIEALEAQIEALEAQIEALKAELENASEELKAEIEAAIEAIEAQIAEIEAAIEAMKAQVEAVQHQIKELYEAALALNDTIEALIEAAKAQTEETIQATIAAIEEAMKAVEDAIDDAKALVEDVVETVENIIDAINSIPEALEQLDEMIAEFVENLGEDIVAELEDMGEQLLADLLAAADALATEGIEALAELVEDLLNDLVDAIEYQLNKAVEAFKKAYLDATTGEYGVGCDSYYVSLGDAAVLSEGTSYADIVAAELEVEYAELADAALTTAGIEGYVAANAEEIAKADLITVSLGTSDISGFVLEQVEAYVNGADTTIDWTALNLDKEIMDVLFGALSETHAFLAEQLTGAEPVDLGFAKVDPVELITLMVDSYLYGTLSFSLNFAPALNAIHAANPEAHVVVVGMANPFEAVVEMMGIEDLDINAVLDAVTSITNLEFLVYTMLTPNTTFVPAPEAESNLNVGAQLGSGFTLVFELAFQTSEAGHAYIAERILNALTVGTEDHVYGEWVSISDTQHQRTCGLCGVAFETEDHDFGEWISAGTNHVRICETCEYVLTGEHADDNDDHECDVCDDKISDCADANSDHKCDICGDAVSEHADANSDHKCDICGEAVSEHADANSDHKCDICGEAVSEHADANNDHKCDICGEAVSEHADANNDHKCDVCGDTVSEHTDANGDNKCDVCDKDLTPEHTHAFGQYKNDKNEHWKECECGHIIEKAAHTFVGDTCKICGYEKQSSGGGSGSGSSKPAIEPTPAPVVNPFIDVNTGDYFYNAILWAVEMNITTGMTDTLFAPNGVCTRAQMVTFLWRAMGSPAPKSTSCNFVDVSADAYYYDAVLWGTENDVIKGTSETTFSPNQTVTRCQTVTFLWRNAGAPKATAACTFTDIVEGAYYYDAVLWAAEEKVTKGTSATTFSPEDPCLRGQIVTLMYNYMAD